MARPLSDHQRAKRTADSVMARIDTKTYGAPWSAAHRIIAREVFEELRKLRHSIECMQQRRRKRDEGE